MNSWKALALALLLPAAGFLAGCSAGNVYEGVRQRETARNTPPEPAPASQLPSRQDYEAERKRLRDSKSNP